MKLLAIDPGDTHSAFIIYSKVYNKGIGYTHIIHDKGKVDNNTLLAMVYNAPAGSITIEMIKSYGMPVGDSVFTTCLWIGRFIEAWEKSSRGSLFLVPRKTVTTHICGRSSASDSNVRAALIDLLGPVGTKKNPGPSFGITSDVWSALALAVTTWESYFSLLN